MLNKKRHIASLLQAVILASSLCAIANAQDISAYRIHSDNDVFIRETRASLAVAPAIENMPLLDCAVEYIRRYQGKDIVYRRGPISLHQAGRLDQTIQAISESGEPATEQELTSRSMFNGGILVDLPKAGETSGSQTTLDDRLHYMIRVSLIPTSYRDSILTARILLERAIVDMQERRLDIRQSEVYSRTIEIRGNEPLNFSLPAWESQAGGRNDIIPASLDEALLVTLETPRFFAFPHNYPDPFSTDTRLTYAVPSPCLIKVSIKIDGMDRVIEEGKREPGIYRLTWNGSDIPDGTYPASIQANDEDGKLLHASTIAMTKNKTAPKYEPPRFSTLEPVSDRIVVSIESGLAYLMPADTRKSLRHMFTHIAARAGYRISRVVEAGIMAGQDAFHEYPGPEVDIDRINDYGGVVPYTYGYVGPYARFSLSNGFAQPLVDAGVAFSNASTLLQLGAGVRVNLLPNIQVTLMPTFIAHFKSDISTKLGLHYGVSLKF